MLDCWVVGQRAMDQGERIREQEAANETKLLTAKAHGRSDWVQKFKHFWVRLENPSWSLSCLCGNGRSPAYQLSAKLKLGRDTA